MALSVTRYYGQLSSCTIPEKTNDPILRKLSDGWIDGQMDKSEFIGSSVQNEQSRLNETYRLFLSESISYIISVPNVSTKSSA